ncbi:hypothetical protein [Haloferula sargassicola]|uniref:Secreted protein n=1 Tax=Haloferula sargassicola TaxID=490096 RepID=A0ABP9UKU8_9BACT
MALLRLVCISFVSVGLSQAETMAWNIPLELLQVGGLHQLTRAVGTIENSDLVSNQDELWDLSGILKIPVLAPETLDPNFDPFSSSADDGQLKVLEPRTFPGDFVFWNQSRRQVVARGSAADLYLLDHTIFELATPVQAILTLDFKSGSEHRSLKIRSRSGCTSSATMGDVHWEFCSNFNSEQTLADISVHVESALPSGKVGIQTAVTLVASKPLCVAKWRMDDLESSVTLGLEFVTWWGTPAGQIRQTEDGTTARLPLAGSHAHTDPVALPNGLFFQCLKFPAARFSDPVEMITAIPEDVKEIIPEGLTQAQDLLRSMGFRSETANAFAGYDPRGERIFVIDTQDNLDLLKEISTSGCIISPHLIECSIGAGNADAMILTRSGEKAHLSVSDQMIDLAPNRSSNGSLIDLAIHLAHFRRASDFVSGLTVVNGIETTLGTFGDEPISVKASVISLK